MLVFLVKEEIATKTKNEIKPGISGGTNFLCLYNITHAFYMANLREMEEKTDIEKNGIVHFYTMGGCVQMNLAKQSSVHLLLRFLVWFRIHAIRAPLPTQSASAKQEKSS